jgi:hypothetical protein
MKSLVLVVTLALLGACGGGKGKPTTPGSATPDNKMQGSAAKKPDTKPDGAPDKDPCAIPPD